MSDIVDMASEIEAEHLTRSLAAARKAVPVGTPGNCDDCGEDSPRLVEGRCAPCRDGRVRIAPQHRAPLVIKYEEEERPMSGKSIQLPAIATTAIRAVERCARERNLSIGHAAAQLIEAGLEPSPAPPPAGTAASARSAISARTALRNTGHATLEALLDSLFPRILPAQMLVGDLALLPGDDVFGAIGIGDGFGTILGWHEAASALAPVVDATGLAIGAWRL